MVELPFLADFFLVLLVAAAAAFLCERLRIPSLVGFLITGLLLGPRATGLVSDPHSIELLAEIGIIVLLFTIGVEISLGQIVQLWKSVLLGGGIQVLVTGLLAAGVATLAGFSTGPAVFIGFVVAMSSTAIVLKLLADRAETATPHGNLSLGILIFQDLSIVPMVLLIPILAGRGGGAGIVRTLLTALGVVAVILLISRRVVPFVLRVIVATRSRELFLLTILAICLGTAWATAQVGLSLGLGAFLAGLLVSESDYGQHALSLTIPFRDALSAMFFVSVGMLLDVGFVAEHALLVLGVTAAILVGKTAVVAFLVSTVLRYPIRVGLLSGLLLSQIGEFSFLLLHVGSRDSIVPVDVRNLLLAVTGASMAFAPLVLRLAPGLTRWAVALAPAGAGPLPDAPDGPPRVLIIGYGVNGQNVARALKHVGVPYRVLELNPDAVRRLRREGERIEYGDATQATALSHAGILNVRIVVVTVPDPASARGIVAQARMLNPAAHIIVRTRFVAEVDALRELGSSEVVPEEFETSLEILSRVLRTLLVPRGTVDQLCREIRSESYEMLRSWGPDAHTGHPLADSTFGDVQFEVFRVAPGSPLAGIELRHAGLKESDGALVLAVRRDDSTTPNPPPGFRFEPGDTVLVLGTPEQLAGAGRRFA